MKIIPALIWTWVLYGLGHLVSLPFYWGKLDGKWQNFYVRMYPVYNRLMMKSAQIQDKYVLLGSPWWRWWPWQPKEKP